MRRSISSSANAGRPSALLDSEARASRYLPRSIKDLRAECKKRQLAARGSKAELVDRLAAHDIVGAHQFSTIGSSSRPTVSQPSVIYRKAAFMQGFKTTAPARAVGDNSTIDFFFFPEVPEPPPTNPFSKLRVPLLPDNYSPDRSPESAHAVETLDEAVLRPEISIVASHPEHVVPAALSEVVGNEGEDMSISDLASAAFKKVEQIKEPGWLKSLWDDFLDDLLGPKGAAGKVAA